MDAAAATTPARRGDGPSCRACFVQLGRAREARGALGDPPAYAGDSPHVLYAEACLLGATGDWTEAAARLERSVQMRPGLGRRAAADPVLGWMRDDPVAASVSGTTRGAPASAPDRAGA